MGDAAHYEKCIRNLVGLHHQHYVDALLAEHRAALSRARAEALEEAAAIASTAPSTHHAEKRICALKRSPAPAAIPVERVREVIMRTIRPAGVANALLGDLGVPLDGAGGAHMCSNCPHDAGRHIENDCLGVGGEECLCVGYVRAAP